MSNMPSVDAIAAFIQAKKPQFTPKIGLILGSGLGHLAEHIAEATTIPYAEIPDFPRSTVAGHRGQMVLGNLGGMPVVCMQGRIHGYEGADHADFKVFIRTLKKLGCESLIITNASGCLRQDVEPGNLMLINDHINLQHVSPLIGPNEEAAGPRFFSMENAYDPHLRQRILQVAQQMGIPLTEGVYVGVTGPAFETPAEIRAFRVLGGDLVGMSTVPEVLVARHCGLRVAAIAVITNYAAGISKEPLSHEGTLYYAQLAAEKLTQLIIHVLGSLHREPC